MARGAGSPRAARRVRQNRRGLKPEDEASIIYTSGTTGVPKGVILTHGNFVSNVATVSEIVEFSAKDTVLSFLPLSHVLERMVTFAYIYKGCTIAYAESVDTVAQNLLEVRPHDHGRRPPGLRKNLRQGHGQRPGQLRA